LSTFDSWTVSVNHCVIQGCIVQKHKLLQHFAIWLIDYLVTPWRLPVTNCHLCNYSHQILWFQQLKVNWNGKKNFLVNIIIYSFNAQSNNFYNPDVCNYRLMMPCEPEVAVATMKTMSECMYNISSSIIQDDKCYQHILSLQLQKFLSLKYAVCHKDILLLSEWSAVSTQLIKTKAYNTGYRCRKAKQKTETILHAITWKLCPKYFVSWQKQYRGIAALYVRGCAYCLSWSTEQLDTSWSAVKPKMFDVITNDIQIDVVAIEDIAASTESTVNITDTIKYLPILNCHVSEEELYFNASFCSLMQWLQLTSQGCCWLSQIWSFTAYKAL